MDGARIAIPWSLLWAWPLFYYDGEAVRTYFPFRHRAIEVKPSQLEIGGLGDGPGTGQFPHPLVHLNLPCLAFGMNILTASLPGLSHTDAVLHEFAYPPANEGPNTWVASHEGSGPAFSSYLPLKSGPEVGWKMASPLTVLLKRGDLQRFTVPHLQDTSSPRITNLFDISSPLPQSGCQPYTEHSIVSVTHSFTR